MKNSKTVQTLRGPVTIDTEKVNGGVQFNVHHLPGKKFGMFAVYLPEKAGKFENEIRDLVVRKLGVIGPDENVTSHLPSCMAAGSGPERKFDVTFGVPEVAHA